MIRYRTDAARKWVDFFVLTDEQEAKKLVARLASISDLRALAPQDYDTLLADMKRLISAENLTWILETLRNQGDDREVDEAFQRGGFGSIEVLPKFQDERFIFTMRVHDQELIGGPIIYESGEYRLGPGKYRQPATPKEMASPEERLLGFLVEGLRRDVHEIVNELLVGNEVEVPDAYRPVMRLKGRVVTYSDQQPIIFPATTVGLMDLVRARPFPFGRCAVCGFVFVQPSRGRTRRYCSERCKAKGIASHAKRTEYARVSRHRRRAREFDIARRVVQDWPKEQHFFRLQNRFRTKSRRELLYLLRKVRQQQDKSVSTSDKAEKGAEA